MPDTNPAAPEDIKAILEALLYVSEDPLQEAEVLALFPGEDPARVRAALEELWVEYQGVPRGLRIVRVAGGYRMQTRPEHDSWIRGLYRQRNKVRLSRAALETLAIVAYRQPITTPEIQSIRGTNPMGVLQTLLDRRLIKVLGRKKVVGKPILYGTTEEFLVHFGLNSLADLPSLEDFGDAFAGAGAAGADSGERVEGLLATGPEVRGADTPPGGAEWVEDAPGAPIRTVSEAPAARDEEE
jgi:segregation and condensation protein B